MEIIKDVSRLTNRRQKVAIVLYGYRLKTNESGISFSVSLELRQLESASMLIGPSLKEVIKTTI